MNDLVRIIPFKSRYDMWYKVQMKRIWLSVGHMKFFKWKTIGEYPTYECAVIDAKRAIKCLNDEWKEVPYEEV